MPSKHMEGEAESSTVAGAQYGAETYRKLLRMSEKTIIAIDPGTARSAVCIIHPDGEVNAWIDSNEGIIGFLEKYTINHVNQPDARLVCEMVASYGMPVGKDIFETVLWAGRFVQAWSAWNGDFDMMYRAEVKLFLCNNTRAKDGNVRQAIIDLYPPTGGGKIPQIGVKKQPGPLYGIAKDMWAALGVALTYKGRAL